MKPLFFFILLFVLVRCSGSPSVTTKINQVDGSKSLPYIGHKDILEIEEDGQLFIDTIYEKIPVFEFLNQDSIVVSNNTFQTKFGSLSFSLLHVQQFVH